MSQLPTTFDQEKAFASNRLQRLPRAIRASMTGLGVLGAATAWMLDGAVLPCLAFKYEPMSVQRRDIEGQMITIETRLASISYEEQDHAFKLQLVRYEVGDRESEAHEALVVPLPKEIAGARALQIAVEANRKAARAS